MLFILSLVGAVHVYGLCSFQHRSNCMMEEVPAITDVV